MLSIASRLTMNSTDFVDSANDGVVATGKLEKGLKEVGVAGDKAAKGLNEVDGAGGKATKGLKDVSGAGKKTTDELKDVGGASKKASSELKAVGGAGNKAAKGMRKGARGADDLTKSEKRLEKQSGGTARALTKVRNVVTAIAFGLAAQDFGATIMEYERFKGQLETTFQGSIEQSELAFKAIENFATETPFTLNQSVEAFVKLRNLGIAPTRALMESMGNTATAMGRDMNQFMEAVADAATGEFERLKEFGIKARSEGDNVAFTFQGVTKTVGKNSDEIVGYLQSIGESNFAGAMETQMSRLPGVVSNLQDNIGGLWRTLGDQGATSALTIGIAAVSGGIGDLTSMINSGYLGEALSIQFGSWIDAGTEMLSWLDNSFYQPMVELLTGRELAAEDNAFLETLSLLGDAAGWVGSKILDLPQNVSAVAVIIVGEVDKLRLSVLEQFAAMGFGIDETFLTIKNLGTSAFDQLELVAAISIDAIIIEFARLVSGIQTTIEALPDAFVPDEWITGLASVNTAILATADAEEQVRAEIAKNQATYQGELDLIDERRARSSAYYQTRRDDADGAIQQALQERDAALTAKDALLEEAAANHEASKSATVSREEHDKLANAYMVAGEAAKESGEKAAKAADKAVKAAQRKLDAVIKATDTERETLDKWYTDQFQALEEAERLGLSSTKTYAELRADVQEKYYGKLKVLNEKAVKDNETALLKQLKDSSVFGDQLVGLYGDWGDTWKSVLTGNVDDAKGSFDDLLDGFTDMLAQMALRWAASGLLGLFSGEGFSGFNSDAFFGGSGSSNTAGTLAALFGGATSEQGQRLAGRLFGEEAGKSFSNSVQTGGQLLGAAGGVVGGVNQVDSGLEQGGVGGAISVVSGLSRTYKSLKQLIDIYNSITQASQAVFIAGGSISTGAAALEGTNAALAGLNAEINATQAYLATLETGAQGATALEGLNSAAPAATATGGALQTAGTVAGVAAGGLNIYAGLNRGGTAGYTQAAGGAVTAAASLGYLSALGPYGAAIGAIISLLAAGRGAREFEQIAYEDYLPDLTGATDARGANGGLGFDGGNLGVFGNNFGNDRAGLSAQHIADGGENGNVGFFTGAQASLDAFKDIVEAAGFATESTDGFLKVISETLTADDIKSLWSEYNDGLETAVTANEIFATSFEARFIQPTNLAYENLAIATGKNADQSRDAILEMDKGFDILIAGGADASDSLIAAFASAFDLSAENSAKFFAVSGQSIEQWVDVLGNNTDEALRELLDFNDQGQTIFDGIADAAALSAQAVGQSYRDELGRLDLGGRGVADLNLGRGVPGNDPAVIQSFDTGTPRLENDGLIYAHQNEIIIDSGTSDVFRSGMKRYFGADVSPGQSSNGDVAELTNVLKSQVRKIEEMLVVINHQNGQRKVYG